MKGPNKKWIWILVSAGSALVALAVWYFWPSSVEDPNKSNTPVPPGSPSPKWVPEVFPLNVGMYGTKIKAMQAALGITADGKFGSQTRGAITAIGYSVPLSLRDYNTIIISKGGSAVQNIAGAYAKFDGVSVYYLSDSSLYKRFDKDQWIGKVSGENSNVNYWDIDGIYRVYKNSVYQKS